MLQRHEVFIDGHWQPGDGAELIQVVNPAAAAFAEVGAEAGVPDGVPNVIFGGGATDYVPYTISPGSAWTLPVDGQLRSVTRETGGAA